MDPQAFGPNFDENKFIQARQLAWKSLDALKNKIKIGMSEDEMHLIVKDYYLNSGIERMWHPTKVRFAQNTTKTFREISDPNTTLQDNDLFFLDLGPVYFDHEADVGRTFLMGDNPDYQKIIDASEIVFKEVELYWQKEFVSGLKLYEFAKATTEKLGFELNLNMDGHRLSDFPHAFIHKAGLGEWEDPPKSGAWVLEIHVIDKKLNRGAFYEDLLGLP
jgi:hypothetical protein